MMNPLHVAPPGLASLPGLPIHPIPLGVPAAPSLPVSNPLGPADVSIAPNNTIYINNLNSKIKRDELKKSLYAVFVQFGQILDIITGKNLKMRGQAFVVFADIASASNALRAMQSFPLYEKPMRIQFAKADSDIISKQKGTYVERPRTQGVSIKSAVAAAAAAAAANAVLEATASQGGQSARAIRRRQQRAAAAAAAAAEAAATQSGGAAIPPPTAASGNYNSYGGTGSLHSSQPAVPPINPANIPDQPPNKILFVTNLPSDADEAMLGMLFTQFSGFREIRMVPGRSDIAFVEFGTEREAAGAKHGLQGFTVRPGHPIRITFAKK